MSDELNKIEEIKPVPNEGIDADATGFDNLNTLADNPFWLPAGSFRSLIAVIIVVCTLGILWTSGKIPPELNTIVSMVLGFYYSRGISK